MRDLKDEPGRPRILFVDPVFGALGGGVMVSCWIAEALADRSDFTWLSWRGLDLGRLNRFAGTTLGPDRVKQQTATRMMRAVGETVNFVDKDPYCIQRWSLLMRAAKRRASAFDLLISCNDEMDFGRPGIQYIHFPYLRASMEWNGTSLGLRQDYRNRPWRMISGFDPARFASNLTLVNSDWTGEHVKELYGLEPRTLYPPVPGDYPERSWDDRDKAVICVGRIAQDKRLERIFEIVRRTRDTVPGLRLRIAGVAYSGPGGDEGLAFARQAAEQNDWVDLHLDLPRDALCDLMCRSRIGIHAKEYEHFGISVAEMVRAGAAVFVHDSGGQVEIVGRDQRLVYEDVDEAAAKVARVLLDAQYRASVLQHLDQQKAMLGTKTFCSKMRAIADEFLATAGSMS